MREREPARSPQQQQGQSQQQRSGRQYGQQAFGQGLRSQVLTVGRWRSLAMCSGDVRSVRGLLNAVCTCSSRPQHQAQRVAGMPKQRRTRWQAPGRSFTWRIMMHWWSAVTSGYVIHHRAHPRDKQQKADPTCVRLHWHTHGTQHVYGSQCQPRGSNMLMVVFSRQCM